MFNLINVKKSRPGPLTFLQRDTKELQNFFQFLSYNASVTENVHHILTPCPLSSYNIDCPETKTVKA